MRFLLALAIIMMTVSAELNVLQLFLGKPAEGTEASALLELDEDNQDYEQMLSSIDTCDPEVEAACHVYGLVQLEDGNTAIVNLGFWDDLKKGFSNVVSKAKEGISKAKDLVTKAAGFIKSKFAGKTKKAAVSPAAVESLVELYEDDVEEDFVY